MAFTLSSQATESGTSEGSATSFGSWTDRTRAAYEDRAREAAKRRSEEFKARLGQTAFDVLEAHRGEGGEEVAVLETEDATVNVYP
jgi:hypothetical protein